jgi:hypothetical protein
MNLGVFLLTFAFAAAPGQEGRLEVSGVRATYGELGATRPDWKIPLGDALHVAFDISGLTTDPSGHVRYRTVLEVENSRGEKIFRPEPIESSLLNIQGGGKVRESVVVLTGVDQTPGSYRLKLTVTDLTPRKDSQREASATQDFALVPQEFGLVRFQLSYDRLGQMPAPPAGGAGQTLFVNAAAVGFKRDAQNNQGGIQVEMSVLDSSDRPMTPKPALVQANRIPVGLDVIPVRFDLPLMRGGTYRLVFKSTDLVTKKSTAFSMPLIVTDFAGTQEVSR